MEKSELFEGKEELSSGAKLNLLLSLMADTRKALDEAKKRKANLEVLYPDYVQVLTDIKALNNYQKELYEIIKGLAKDVFIEGGEKTKKLNKFVSVTTGEELLYEPTKAVAWAVEKELLQLLDVNKDEFEKVASALDLDFVSKTTKYGVRLASDLSEVETSKRLEEPTN